MSMFVDIKKLFFGECVILKFIPWDVQICLDKVLLMYHKTLDNSNFYNLEFAASNYRNFTSKLFYFFHRYVV